MDMAVPINKLKTKTSLALVISKECIEIGCKKIA
jgi:hypothetical protein